MRMAFGLVGVLVGLGVLVWMMSDIFIPHTQSSLKAREVAKEQINAISGKDPEGVPFSETLKLKPDPEVGPLLGLRVTQIVPGSPLETHFGLMNDDLIVDIGGQKVKDINDADIASAYVMESKARQWNLVVLRGGLPITLPQQGAVVGGGTAAPPATPSNSMRITIPGQ